MKYVILSIFFMNMSICSMAQNKMDEALYPPELVMRYKSEIGLSEKQEQYMKATFSKIQAQFTSLQWDLTSAQLELEKIILAPTSDVEAAKDKMKAVLETEQKIKLLQLELMLKIKNKLTAKQKTQLDEYKSKQ